MMDLPGPIPGGGDEQGDHEEGRLPSLQAISLALRTRNFSPPPCAHDGVGGHGHYRPSGHRTRAASFPISGPTMTSGRRAPQYREDLFLEKLRRQLAHLFLSCPLHLRFIGLHTSHPRRSAQSPMAFEGRTAETIIFPKTSSHFAHAAATPPDSVDEGDVLVGADGERRASHHMPRSCGALAAPF